MWLPDIEAVDANSRPTTGQAADAMNCDLELEIAPADAPGMYRVDVDSPAGAASGVLRLDAAGFLVRRRELAAAVLASAVPLRTTLSAQEQPVREVGRSLFESIFTDRVYGRYTASLQEAARRGEPLRIVLRLRAPELAGLPWEMLFDPEANEYLCQREPLVRYVETAAPAAPVRVDPPLRILGLVAAPLDLPKLDVAEERRRLADAVADLGQRRQVELVWAPRGSWAVLQETLLAGPWHVLHFIGHGGVVGDTGVLALEDEYSGRASLVSAGRFTRLLHACRPVPRLVVLNSCQGGEAAADDLLSSTSASLVHSGISAAVAMQFAVTDPAALAFARGFYQALTYNQPVDEAVRLGRIAINGTAENTLEWLTPVLYLRTDDTRLFAIGTPAASPGGDRRYAPEQAAHEASLHSLYVQALAALRTNRTDEAIALLDSLLTLDPDYRDATERREAARRNQQLAMHYERARAAEDHGDWDTAAREYEAVLTIDGTYRDAAERKAACRSRRHVESLRQELRLHAESGEWQAVLGVSEELAALDPQASDVEEAAATAREHLLGADVGTQDEDGVSVQVPLPSHRRRLAERLWLTRSRRSRGLIMLVLLGIAVSTALILIFALRGTPATSGAYRKLLAHLPADRKCEPYALPTTQYPGTRVAARCEVGNGSSEIYTSWNSLPQLDKWFGRFQEGDCATPPGSDQGLKRRRTDGSGNVACARLWIYGVDTYTVMWSIDRLLITGLFSSTVSPQSYQQVSDRAEAARAGVH